MLDQISEFLLTAGGLAVLVTFLVNLGKVIKIVPDGKAGDIAKILNFLVFRWGFSIALTHL